MPEPLQKKSDVVEMLQHAAELGHALCVQYLYAAFSQKVGGDPQLSAPITRELSASKRALLQRWCQLQLGT